MVPRRREHIFSQYPNRISFKFYLNIRYGILDLMRYVTDSHEKFEHHIQQTHQANWVIPHILVEERK